MGRLGRSFSLGVTCCILVTLLLPFGCRRVIYPFREAPAQPAGIPRTTAKLLPAEGDAPEIEVWVAEPLGDKPVVVYFMGNAGNLAYSGPRINEFVSQGFGFAGMAYRGGGGRPGEPSEAALKADAQRLYRDLDQLFAASVPPERRVIYGSSLGTGIATDLAASVPEKAVILETPFTRLCDIAELRFTSVPACLVMRNERYDSIDQIADIGAPLLIQHGQRDEVIPFELGQRLFEAASEPKTFIGYPDGNHNDLRLYGAGIDAIKFINAL